MSEESTPPPTPRWRRFGRWLRALIPESREGPCRYCGKLTSQTNPLDPNIFRHQACREEYNDKERERKEEAAQIALIRKALVASGCVPPPRPAGSSQKLTTDTRLIAGLYPLPWECELSPQQTPTNRFVASIYAADSTRVCETRGEHALILAATIVEAVNSLLATATDVHAGIPNNHAAQSTPKLVRRYGTRMACMYPPDGSLYTRWIEEGRVMDFPEWIVQHDNPGVNIPGLEKGAGWEGWAPP